MTEKPSARRVQSADDSETIHGSAGSQARRVIPVAGETIVNADSMSIDRQQSTNALANGIAPAKFNVPAAEPLSRFALPESASDFDPGQTLRDWAEGAGLLVAFGVVALWLLRQWITRRDLPGGSMSYLRTIESLALPQRCRLHLVEADGRQVLVAADAAGIKSVTVLPDRFAHLLDTTDEQTGAGVVPPIELPEPARVVAWHGLQESQPA